jgi:hypothetical protein
MSILNICDTIIQLQKNPSINFKIVLSQDRHGGVCVQDIDNPSIQYKIVQFESSQPWPFISDPRAEIIIQNSDMQNRWGLEIYRLERAKMCNDIPHHLQIMALSIFDGLRLLYNQNNHVAQVSEFMKHNNSI